MRPGHFPPAARPDPRPPGGEPVEPLSARVPRPAGPRPRRDSGNPLGGRQAVHWTPWQPPRTFSVYTFTASDGSFSPGTSSAFKITPASASLSQSQLSVSSAATVQLGAAATITLQAKDAFGNTLTSGGLSVAFKLAGSGTSNGTLSGTTDHGNGAYTATFTATSPGTARQISATLSGSAITSTLPTHHRPQHGHHPQGGDFSRHPGPQAPAARSPHSPFPISPRRHPTSPLRLRGAILRRLTQAQSSRTAPGIFTSPPPIPIPRCRPAAASRSK